MKTIIVCGLLGAGKTTFIQHLLRDSREETVLLVNDFGQSGIDGEILSADGIESIELPSGCVCCTLKFDLITTVQRIIGTFAPERLIIEPSGIASPSGVLEALETLQVKPVTVVGIVDATEFVELHGSQMYGSFFEDQIVSSDIVLVNKTDLADEGRAKGALSLVEQMNPGAIVFSTVKAAISEPLPEIANRERSPVGHHHLHFETLSLRINTVRAFAFYANFFEDMARGLYGNVVRAKALARTDEGPYRFDLSHGSIDNIPFGRDITDSRIVIIGTALKKDIILLMPEGYPFSLRSCPGAKEGKKC